MVNNIGDGRILRVAGAKPPAGYFCHFSKGFCGARRTISMTDVLISTMGALGSDPVLTFAESFAYATLNSHNALPQVLLNYIQFLAARVIGSIPHASVPPLPLWRVTPYTSVT